MLWIVLPRVALTGLTAVDVLVVVFVEIIFVIDVNVAVVPIAIAPIAPVSSPRTPGGCTYRNPRTPSQGRPWPIAGIAVVVIRSFSRSSSVNDRWIVRWDVSYVGTSLLNLDHLFTAFDSLRLHGLLRAGF
jgi:hypothetical protein